MSAKTIARTAAAIAVSGGLAAGGLMPAATAQASERHYGWVKVCQYIHDWDDHDYDYGKGKYSIKNDYGQWYFWLDADYDDYTCYKKKVRTGWTKVSVHHYPDETDYDGDHDSYRFYVKKDRTYVVNYHYHTDEDEHRLAA